MDFDEMSEARLALIGGKLLGTEEMTEKILDALRDIAEGAGEVSYHPEGDNDECRFDIAVTREGCAVTGTITAYNYVTEASDDTECDTHDLPEELLELLKAKGIVSFTATYSGGGDSGSCDDISFQDANGDSSDGEVRSALAEFAETAAGTVSLDWYNNEGGGGTLEWSADAGEGDETPVATSSFYSNESVEVDETAPIEVQLPEVFCAAAA